MVRNKTTIKRLAFTLIELIFAIIIISIAVVSLPVMAKITERGIESNILQEAIFAGSAELMGASAGYWDTNSMSDNAFSHISRVIDVNPGAANACENNITSPTHRLRPGHIAQPLHRRCVEDTTGNLAVATDANYPDLNDAVHGTQDMFIGTTKATGYKEIYKSTLTIPIVANSDTKTITVEVRDSNEVPITRLSIVSANIGEIDYFKRRF